MIYSKGNFLSLIGNDEGGGQKKAGSESCRPNIISVINNLYRSYLPSLADK